MIYPEKPVFTQIEEWSFDTLSQEFESRLIECDENGDVEGYKLMGYLEHSQPFAKHRGNITWVQAAVMDNEDVRFAQRHGWQTYCAYEPAQDLNQGESTSKGRRLRRFAAKVLGLK